MNTPFIAASQQDQRDMLHEVGAASFDDLFSGIPAGLQTERFDLPAALSELELDSALRALAARNAGDLVNFCGAGFYDHFIPAAVDAVTSRGEFYTAYTPYQPEASQGTLQAIYEYQTAIARLTEMDAANASLYDGGTALFESVMMALRCTGRRRVLVDEGVNPIYRTMLRSYTRNLEIACEEIPLAGGRADRAAMTAKLDADVAAIVLQNPNFFGCLDDLGDLAAAAHEAGALAVCSAYPIALGLVKTPGAMGVDIVTGEGQSLGLPLAFGGPYLGFMATRMKYVRKMPGRIAGATRDAKGRRGFVLTLQAREQHIRREKAMSNICTNEALCALRAVVYLSLVGKSGLVDVARTCASRAAYARERLAKVPGVRPAFPHPFFNEFAVTLPCPASELISRLLQDGIAAGFPVSRYYKGMENVLLLAFTEKRTKDEIDALAEAVEKVL
ncbi:MAG: aminomethyl-transferring glycine dehydrogenase subunit GcvPA [Kiritimatiellae bacterium]|nr:aminomethyl-transferring glycine dehydrogenase subunit GcvPA [Kiritimatiellia bacterium]